MKTYRCLFALLMVTGLWLAVGTPLQARPDQEALNEEEMPPPPPPQMEGEAHPDPMDGPPPIGEKMVNRLLKRIGDTDPEKAAQLKQLQKEDPYAFQKEIHDMLQNARPQRGEHSGRRGRPADIRGNREAGERIDEIIEKHTEYLEWLEANYPEEAESLDEVREESPRMYTRRLGLSIRKYGRIAKASKENPELAEVLKEDLALNQKRNDLIEQIRDVNDSQQQETLTAELKEVIEQKYDVLLKRREIAYQQLEEKLKDLQDQLDKSYERLETWRDPQFKQAEVQKRLEKILGQSDEFKWD